MRSILLCGLLLAFTVDAAPRIQNAGELNCGSQPKRLYGFDPTTTACWADAVLPAAAIGYSTGRAPGTEVAAATWSELQQLVSGAKASLHILLQGAYTAESDLRISGKVGITISGPARISCRAGKAHPVVIVSRSSGITLRDLTFSGCSNSAIIVNGTAAGKPTPITADGVGSKPPDVVLQGVTVRGCRSERGAGVAIINSRVVLQDCNLQDNVADGCGGGVYAESSSLLVKGTRFQNNLGNNTAGDASCRGGALHAQKSWLAVTQSSFRGNKGVNGSAILLVLPVGVGQLQDSEIIDNHERPGVSKDFFASSGAVTVVGEKWLYVSLARGRSGDSCIQEYPGLAIARCSFKNNTAALTGGEGGGIAVFDAFLAVINTTVVGIATTADAFRTDSIATTGAADAAAAAQYSGVARSAFQGGCMSIESASFYMSGSVLRQCSARFVGGALSMLAVTAVVKDSIISDNTADMGAGLRVTNGYLSLSNVSVNFNTGLSTGAGIYMESNDELHVHIERANVQHNIMSGRGGGILAEMVEDTAKFVMSIHDSNISRNVARYGGAMAFYSVGELDLSNNYVAHNKALKFGGGLHCARYYGADQTFHSVNNMWLNNTALVRGGGIVTHPCNMTSYGDTFLANRALQEGGGFMAYGGERIKLQKVQLSCNAAQNGGGIMVKEADSGDQSHVTVTCSNVTNNGGALDAARQADCMAEVLSADQRRSSDLQSFMAAAAAAGASSTALQGVAGASAAAEKGGGMYVAADQFAVVFNSSIDSNVASSSGGGVFLDRGAVLRVLGAGSSVSSNNCTGGSGGAMFMEEGTVLTATDTTWSNNYGMFGGGIFALGKETELRLRGVTFSNNTAAAGGAVATLGGSRVTCSSGCRFNYNRAKVGGALMLHSGSVNITRSTFLANTAAAATGTATAAATGTGTTTGTIQYMLGEIQVSAGGAAYVWRGNLTLDRCSVNRNVAWGPTGRGGGVFVDDAHLHLTDTQLSNNWATAAGGAVLLGPVGLQQLLDVRGGLFAGNCAGSFGGAVAGGLLLPDDAAAAISLIRADDGSGSSQWMLRLTGTKFSNNTAGRQGGAVACSLCDRVLLQSVDLQQNAAVQTGGGVSCVRCNKILLDNTTFNANSAASGGGSCILAAGPGSASKDSKFLGNAAGATAAVASTKRLSAAAAAAMAVAGRSITRGTAAPASSTYSLPTAQQALPACGVVGSGGGLCLGLWDTEFLLQGSGTFANNTALFGAGLFIEACSGGPLVCPVNLNVDSVRFKHNALSSELQGSAVNESLARHLLQVQADTAAAIGDSLGSGADLYVTNATVLVAGNRSAAAAKRQQRQQLISTGKLEAAAPAAGGQGKQPSRHGTATSSPKADGRHLLAEQTRQSVADVQSLPLSRSAAMGSKHSNTSSNHAAKLLVVAKELAAATARGGRGTEAGSAGSVVNRVATGPAQLGAVVAAGDVPGDQSGPSSLMSSEVEGTVGYNGRLQGLSVPVLDQLGGQVVNDVAEQLSVQATADFGNCTACQLSGISKVLPVNGTAQFDQLQLLAQPGSNQTIRFKLLSALEGVELAGGGQSVQVFLPSCHWGQATTAVGCYNCTSPLFSFSPITGKCSICPQDVAVCSSTTLLPDSGYWNSGPLSTRMHKCPRRAACIRDTNAMMTMQCLQQQELILNNPDFASDHLGSSIAGSSNSMRSIRPLTPWDSLRQQCVPILQSWAAGAAADASSDSGRRRLLQAAGTSNPADITLDPYLNSSAAIQDGYRSLLCAQGYRGRLCSDCVFPGTATDGPYGKFYTGCGKCPSWTTSIATYVLSRVFDVCIVGLLILTTLVEMKKRRITVSNARKAAFHKMASSVASTAASAVASNQPAGQAAAAAAKSKAPAPVAAAAKGSASAVPLAQQGSLGSAQLAAHHAGSLTASVALSHDYDDTPLPPLEGFADDHRHHLQQQQQQQSGSRYPMRIGFPQFSQGSVQGSGHMQASHQQQHGLTHRHSHNSELEIRGSGAHHHLHQQQQLTTAFTASSIACSGSADHSATPPSAFAMPGAVPAAAVSAGNSGATAPAQSAAAAAAVPATRRRQRQRWKRGPLFAREVKSGQSSNVINYSPAQLTTVELFEVFKDFLQVLSILQAVSLGWQSAAALAMSSVSITPMSTKAWISLDCILPRTQYMADMQPFYHIAAAILEPVLYAVLMLLVWFSFAASLSLRTNQAFWRVTIGRRLKAPIICSLLVLLSFFYPSLAYTILGVFSCRYLDPTNGNTTPGEVLSAQGWYWTADLNRQCFVDPGHRAIALGLGIPGTLLLLTYPLLQGIILAREANAGRLTPTSEFFADYGHLVEDFRPRLFYWGSIVELRKLVLVALVLGLASTGVISQLVGCSLVLLGYCAATMGLLPYPYRLLNRLHLGSTGVLLAVLWLNLFVAVGEEGGMLSGGMSPKQSLALQLLSVALVIMMILILLCMCTVRLYRKVKGVLDVDGDGKISRSDIQALLTKLKSKFFKSKGKSRPLSKFLPCLGSCKRRTTAT